MSDEPPRQKPILFETAPDDAGPDTDPASAPPVPEPGLPEPVAVRTALAIGQRRLGWFGRVFWSAVLMLLGTILTVAAWDFAVGLIERNVWLGRGALVLLGVVALGLLIVAVREIAALARLGRIDTLRARAGAARERDRTAAVSFTRDLAHFYRDRPDLEWAQAELDQRRDQLLDAPDLVDFAETTFCRDLDQMAQAEVTQASRQVAVATALIPLAMIDVLSALTINIRMIRRVAEIYGGRAGSIGSFRLMRAVAGHLVATGAVAVGDDLLGTALGGGVIAKLSRRFGEGLVNGALTARVGIAAMEVCRPMPFQALQKPSVSRLIKSALSDLF